MSEYQANINKLLEKLSELLKRQESFQEEIEALKREIRILASRGPEPAIGELTDNETVVVSPVEIKEEPSPVTEEVVQKKEEPVSVKDETSLWKEAVKSTDSRTGKGSDFRTNLEKFIGENLINKIGIVILVIGVGIGAKYAIDHDLISPWTRIILGYILGLGLLGFAIRLKKEYKDFSAVLLSGSMAIMYFITFAAFSFYALIPLVLTFSLMVLFTVFTVAAAVYYDRQVIAHIGLVGAYAVPFLLSDGSGKVVILFSYMAIINAGILVIAFRKYWKPLYYSAFLLSWLIFITWYVQKYENGAYFGLAWIFISIFFLTFYVIILAYKLLRKEKFRIDDIILLLANSAVFYGLGYSVLRQNIRGEDFLGMFTLINGLLHFIVSVFVFRIKGSDRNLFYFIAGMVIAFLTIAIPVQLDGNWVTMLWSAEAVALFWIGRTKNTFLYELLSYILMGLAFFCITLGWKAGYHTNGVWADGEKLLPLFNMNFLTSLLFIASFAYIIILNLDRKITEGPDWQLSIRRMMNFIIPSFFLIVLYFAFYLEISAYWNQLFISGRVNVDDPVSGLQNFSNDNITYFKTISFLIYSMVFLAILSFVNILWLKKSVLGLINLGFSLAAVGLCLSVGLIALGSLRESYLGQELSKYFYRGFMLIGLRYILFAFLAVLLYSVYRYIKEDFLGTDLRVEFDLFLQITILTIVSNELINWMDLSGSQHSYKLGLSILFGVYSVLLIVLGIWKKKLHLRIGAIVLFSLTLLKLFFYDLSSLDTIAKTIVFIVLGVLLLIISFLYTKYRKLIFGDDKDE